MAKIIVSKTKELNGLVCAPASKSYTQRMVIAAALANGASKINNPLFSEDTEATLRAVTALGAGFKAEDGCWSITGAQPLRNSIEPIDCGESGATLRFMIPVASLANGPSTLLFKSSFERRPVKPLLDSLKQIGSKVQTGKLNDLDAVFVNGGGIIGGKTTITGNVSSQFISGLLLACPMAKQDTEIFLTSPLESIDYVRMTAAVLSNYQITLTIKDQSIVIPANQTYKAADVFVPGDFSSASFLFAAVAMTHSKVKVCNLDYRSIQGDKAIVTVLKRMGVKVDVYRDSVEIEGTGAPLQPINIDAKNIPDLVPIIAVLACYAKGISKIYGARRLRFKESDRLQTLYQELNKMGAHISVNDDGLTIKGAILHGAIIDPHNDHRIAMASAVAAIGAEGQTTIRDAECIRKSYPQFYTHLKQLGVDVIDGELVR